MDSVSNNIATTPCELLDVTTASYSSRSSTHSNSSMDSCLRKRQHYHRVSFGRVSIRLFDKTEVACSSSSVDTLDHTTDQIQDTTGNIAEYQQLLDREHVPWCCMLLSSETQGLTMPRDRRRETKEKSGRNLVVVTKTSIAKIFRRVIVAKRSTKGIQRL